MTYEKFWQVIDLACQPSPELWNDWEVRLIEALVEFPASEIVEWNHIFDDLARQAFHIDLWTASYLIHGFGLEDDSFYYFRCWLIGMGRVVYENALANADSLADVVSPDWGAKHIDASAEIYAVAHIAWMKVTGNDDSVAYPARDESADWIGEEWDYEDDDEMKKRLPRLVKLSNYL